MSFDFLKDLQAVELLENANLQKFTTIRLKARGSIALVSTLPELRELILRLRERKIHYHLIGWGSNQIISNTKNTLFIKLKMPLDRGVFKQPQDEYALPASAPLNILQAHAQKFGLKGWEAFTGVPASLGGAIYMNAGTALGEIGALVTTVTLMGVDGELKTIKTGKKSFGYRQNYFVEAGE
ncbi:MAG: FAD-binding protein, partial [Bacteriovoracaceae bacterium]